MVALETPGLLTGPASECLLLTKPGTSLMTRSLKNEELHVIHLLKLFPGSLPSLSSCWNSSVLQKSRA